LLLSKIGGFEPVGDDELALFLFSRVVVLLVLEQDGRRAEEQVFVGEVREGFGDPDDIEGAVRKVVSHLFGVELDVLDRTFPDGDLLAGSILPGSSSLSGRRSIGAGDQLVGKLVSDLDLLRADRHARHVPSALFGQITGRPAYSTTDVQDPKFSGSFIGRFGSGLQMRRKTELLGVFRGARVSGSREEELDEVHLSDFFGEIVGLRGPVTLQIPQYKIVNISIHCVP
jgi:hypothetical protein